MALYPRAGQTAVRLHSPSSPHSPTARPTRNASHASLSGEQLARRASIAFVGAAPEAQNGRRRIKKVEDELWNIFSCYTVNSDPMFPGHMRGTTFIQLLNDCCLLSRISKEAVQVAIVAQCKTEKKVGPRVSPVRATGGTKHKPASLKFPDFLEVLRALAPRAYPRLEPDRAFKRLVLDDVFLYAKRRVVNKTQADMIDGAVARLVEQDMAVGIRNVFNFFAKQSEQRRQVDASHATTTRALNEGVTGQVTVTARHKAKQLKGKRSNLGFPEFTQFLRDFKINGGQGRQALLTVSECTEVYLAVCPPYDNSSEPVPDITEKMFQQVLVFLSWQWSAAVAHDVDKVDRVKAFFLHLWKASNPQDGSTADTYERIQNRIDTGSVHTGGRLNFCGSAAFTEAFLHIWEKDDYRDYLTSTDQYKNDGAALVRSLFKTRRGAASKALEAVRKTPSPKAEPSNEPVVLRTSDLRQLFAQRTDIRDLVVLAASMAEDEAAANPPPQSAGPERGDEDGSLFGGPPSPATDPASPSPTGRARGQHSASVSFSPTLSISEATHTLEDYPEDEEEYPGLADVAEDGGSEGDWEKEEEEEDEYEEEEPAPPAPPMGAPMAPPLSLPPAPAPTPPKSTTVYSDEEEELDFSDEEERLGNREGDSDGPEVESDEWENSGSDL